MKRKLYQYGIVLAVVVLLTVILTFPASAAIETPFAPITPGGGPGSQDPNIQISINGEGSDAVRILLLMTILTLLPSILVMMTSFTRIVIVFSLLRNAIGLQQTPPNQVIVGLALFLTLFIMFPVINTINEEAYKPLSEGDISSTEFLDRAKVPLRDFMIKQTQPEDTELFFTLANKPRPETVDDYTMDVVIPAFMTSEVKRAFIIGFYIFIPFLIIDMVVASTLMSMGMMMLPPATISLPFKLMLFVLVDGWGLLIKALVSTYQL